MKVNAPLRLPLSMTVPLAAMLLASCGSRSIEGTYNVSNAPTPGVTATFGKNSFVLSTGASGNCEVNGNKVILTGNSLTGTYEIKGKDLVGDRLTFVPRDPNDKSPVNQGPRGSSYDHETGVSSGLGSGRK